MAFMPCKTPGSPFTHPYLDPGLAPHSLGSSLLLITTPQTPRPTPKLSWLKLHPGSTPGLDSPAAPCRLSNTSPRWPSACAARSPPKPEPWPQPHPTARPRLCPGLSCLPAHREGTELGPHPSPLPCFHLPPAPPASVGKTKVCVSGSGPESG